MIWRTASHPGQEEEAILLSSADVFSSRLCLVWCSVWSSEKRSQTPWLLPDWCSQLLSWPSRKGEMVVLGSLCMWVAAVGGRECVELQRRVFSDLEGWVTSRVCMLLAGPLPSGVTHSWERVAARSAACHAWLWLRAG